MNAHNLCYASKIDSADSTSIVLFLTIHAVVSKPWPVYLPSHFMIETSVVTILIPLPFCRLNSYFDDMLSPKILFER